METSTFHQERQPKRDVSGWMEKRQEDRAVKVSPESIRDAMSRQAGQARVKPRPVPPPHGPGGRCRGTDGRGPSSSDA